MGKENLVVYFLLTFRNHGDVIPVEDNFLNEHFFALSINTLCLAFFF